MPQDSQYDHRYRKNKNSIRFDSRDEYKSFTIERVQDYPTQKLGEGPYRVLFKGKEIFRNEYYGPCKYYIENLVNDYYLIVDNFKNKWKLSTFPTNSDI